MRRPACVSAAALVAACSLAGAAAGAAGTGWHVTPVRSFGSRIGTLEAAAVNRFGTSIVVFATRRSFTVARRTEHGSTFEVSGRLSARNPSVLRLTALADGRFLLVYTAGLRLMVGNIDAAGRFRARPHVLAGDYSFWRPRGSDLIPGPPVIVDSDASRTVVVWGPVDGTTERVVGATDDRGAWSGPKVFYSRRGMDPANPGLFSVALVHDSRGRFLVSLHGANGDTTAGMWGLRRGSRQWERVTPPQAANRSTLASVNGETLGSVDGAITAAWQDGSGALVVSTWDGSAWTKPVTAIAGRRIDRNLVTIESPLVVSDGPRAAIVWYTGLLTGPVEATIRGPGGSWSAPLVFPHSAGGWSPLPLTPQDTFWFTPSGALAGAYSGDPITHPVDSGPGAAGLWVGRVGRGAASATALSRTLSGGSAGGGAGLAWFALPRAGGRTTIVWADRKGREFSATATGNAVVRQKRRLPGPSCVYPTGVSNPDAPVELLQVNPPSEGSGDSSICPAVLLW